MDKSRLVDVVMDSLSYPREESPSRGGGPPPLPTPVWVQRGTSFSRKGTTSTSNSHIGPGRDVLLEKGDHLHPRLPYWSREGRPSRKRGPPQLPTPVWVQVGTSSSRKGTTSTPVWVQGGTSFSRRGTTFTPDSPSRTRDGRPSREKRLPSTHTYHVQKSHLLPLYQNFRGRPFLGTIKCGQEPVQTW